MGRILVRKLLLRGYKVRALVRRKPGRGEGGANSGTGEVVEGIPAAVKVVFGDVGDMRDCQEAVRGADKVRYSCRRSAECCCSPDKCQLGHGNGLP